MSWLIVELHRRCGFGSFNVMPKNFFGNTPVFVTG